MSKKQKKSSKEQAYYLVATQSINQELHTVGTVPGVDPYQLVKSMKQAKKLALKIAKKFNTSDSKFAIQPLSDDSGDWKLHAIVHVYLDNNFKPVAEADNQTEYGAWHSIMIDIHKLTVK